MKTKKMILNAILLAIGALLHQITPALGLPMQPDFALAMLFIIILLNEDYKTALVAGIITGIFTALTTKFPGGQIPNMIDKVVTTHIIYFMLIPLRNRFNNNFKIALTLVIGTIISGAIFLASAAIIVGLPASFTVLFLSVVLPAAVINIIAGLILYNAITLALKRSGVSS